MSKLAIVIPWFGRELRGGAELHAWQLATHLAARNHSVEVLTTCCRSHSEDWGANHLSAGLTREEEGFAVRRFEVEPRNQGRFDEANRRLLAVDRSTLRPGVPPVSAEDEHTFCQELIRSPALLNHLEQHKYDYDAVILLPYLYGPVIRGVHLVADRALLQPCLHDEVYAYLPAVARSVFAARRLLFLSEGERKLAISLFGPGIIAKSVLAGAGVDFSTKASDDSILPSPEGARYVLCLGRKDSGKNTDFLAKCFLQFKQRRPESGLTLVIAGPGKVLLPIDCPDLVELGVVSEAQKLSLLRHCAALFHPSENESYSRVIMEAWLVGRPTAAHTNCLATATAVTAGGGYLAATAEEWISLFFKIDDASDTDLTVIGEAGRKYASQIASWDNVIERYEVAIEDSRKSHLVDRPISFDVEKAPVHQVLPNIAFGDAISTHAVWLKKALRKSGYPSEIFALGIDPKCADQARPFTDSSIAPGEAVIYHHSIGSALIPALLAHQGSKCLVYHNITPHRFLESYLPMHARLCREGRNQLQQLAPHFPVNVGDSNYNAIELAEAGFCEPGVLPLCIDPAKWQKVPDAALMERLQDGRTNVLFVGRISPQKKQEDLIYAFSKLRELDRSARLVLVGTAVTTNDYYLACLKQLCKELQLEHAVEFSGHVSDEQLIAYYRTAHVFWSMSEHEGFCVPLIEAMWFDVPVFAYAASAVPETMGGCGCTFSSKQDPTALATQALELARNPRVRRWVIDGQHARRVDFLEEPVTRCLNTLLAKMHPSKAAPAPSPPQKIDAAAVRRIAVVKLDHIGDLLLASPAFDSLHQRFPDAAITAIVAPNSSEILRNHPSVAEIVPYDPPWFWREVPPPETLPIVLARNTKSLQHLGRGHFDLVVNLRSDLANLLFAASLPHTHLLSYTNQSPYPFLITHPLTRTRGMHICEQHQALLAEVGAVTWAPPRLHPSERDRQTVGTTVRVAPRTVAIFAGAGVPLKRWSPVKFRELVRRLRLRGLPIAIVGTKADHELAATIVEGTGADNLCGTFDLLELAVFLEKCAVLVTNDSAPMHIGAAVGTIVIYITRPNTVEEFAPVGPHHLRCCLLGCAHPCDGFDAERRGGLPDFCRCIQSITVDEVEAKVWEVVGSVHSDSLATFQLSSRV